MVSVTGYAVLNSFAIKYDIYSAEANSFSGKIYNQKFIIIFSILFCRFLHIKISRNMSDVLIY